MDDVESVGITIEVESISSLELLLEIQGKPRLVEGGVLDDRVENGGGHRVT
jgi:hypothetical protein